MADGFHPSPRPLCTGLAGALLGLALPPGKSARADTPALQETPFLAGQVTKGELPPVAERLPKRPIVVDLAAKGRELGHPGGQIVSLVGRARDIRYLSASFYTRLVGY